MIEDPYKTETSSWDEELIFNEEADKRKQEFKKVFSDQPTYNVEMKVETSIADCLKKEEDELPLKQENIKP